jgi:preprotein translocase subunit YajC
MTASGFLQWPLLVAMAAPADQNAPIWVQFVPFVMIAVIFYVLLVLPMKRKQRKVDEFLAALKVGDRVVTSGGIYGQITKVNDRSVQLQVADKVRIEVARAAITGYQGQEPVADAPAN